MALSPFPEEFAWLITLFCKYIFLN